MKNILKYLFAVWGLVIFLVSMIVFYPIFLFFFLFNKNNSEIKSHKMRGLWGGLLLFFFIIRIKKHFTHIDYGKGNCIFICNHRSMLDILICNAVIPVRYVFLAKQGLAKVPLFGYIIKHSSILVSRKSNLQKFESYNELKKILFSGGSVLLFPEGTRNVSSQYLTSFQNGAFRLAVETNKPIMIITLWNTADHISKKLELVPGKVDMFIQGPYYPEISDPRAIQKLKNLSFEIMSENIQNLIQAK
jgi:1-acyl-sn-glycerol-3-phosphate acyltransferase